MLWGVCDELVPPRPLGPFRDMLGHSVYQTIQRLARDGLVEVAATERAENRPERTMFRITDAGRATLNDWLHTMLSAPAREYPEFPAALSFLPNLAPADAVEALAARLTRLEERLAALSTGRSQRLVGSCPACSRSSRSTSGRSSTRS